MVVEKVFMQAEQCLLGGYSVLTFRDTLTPLQSREIRVSWKKEMVMKVM